MALDLCHTAVNRSSAAEGLGLKKPTEPHLQKAEMSP